ncbi:MAG: dTDP-4-dehydrorhamnose reductase [Fermentimonas sp.]|jgi:dTDP-4-dehydrorhamnose reductase
MAVVFNAMRLIGAETKVEHEESVFYGLVQQNVLVTGGNGQLGQSLRRFVDKANLPFRFIFCDVDELNIVDIDQVAYFVRANAIRYIVNCAAYTAVDKAEGDYDMAYAVNVTGVENLAKVAKEYSVKIIHISTDYVFDGKSSVPYSENDVTAPLSVYGETKLEGEKALMSVGGECMIIRSSWLYSEFGNNFVKTMLRLMAERDSLRVVSDETGSPTYAVDLAEMIVHVLLYSYEHEWKEGIYNFCNRGEVSRFDFAQEIKRLAGIEDCIITPISSSDYVSPAVRPAYSALDVSKIENAFKVQIPMWNVSLERCIKRIKNID